MELDNLIRRSLPYNVRFDLSQQDIWVVTTEGREYRTLVKYQSEPDQYISRRKPTEKQIALWRKDTQLAGYLPGYVEGPGNPFSPEEAKRFNKRVDPVDIIDTDQLFSLHLYVIEFTSSQAKIKLYLRKLASLGRWLQRNGFKGGSSSLHYE